MDRKHASVLARELGVGEGGGVYAQDDDGNPAWESVSEDESDIEVQSRWRKDDLDNRENLPEMASTTVEEGQDNTRKMRGLVSYWLSGLPD